MKYKYEIALGLISIALACSIIISIMPTSEICDPNKGCDVVLNSKYSHTLGMKNSYFGVIGFGVLFFLLLSHIKNPSSRKKKTIIWLVLIGAIIAAYFIALQYFSLKAYCKYCIITDVTAILALIVVLMKR